MIRVFINWKKRGVDKEPLTVFIRTAGAVILGVLVGYLIRGLESEWEVLKKYHDVIVCAGCLFGQELIAVIERRIRKKGINFFDDESDRNEP